MRRYEPVSGIEGVSPGGTATAKLPDNRRHLMVKINTSCTIAAATDTDPTHLIDTVICQVKGKTIREEKASDLVALRTLAGLGADPSNALCLYFAEPNRAAVNDELLSAWDTFDAVHDFTLKLKLLSTGITNPSINIIDVYDSAVLRDPKGVKARQILKRTPYTYNLGTTGDINNLPVDLPIQRIYLKGATAAITHVKVVVNDTETVFDMDATQNKSVLNDYGLDATAFGANAFPLLFDVEQQLLKRLEGIRSLAIRVTSASAQSITALVEQAAPDYF
jgi:hypothetical protein